MKYVIACLLAIPAMADTTQQNVQLHEIGKLDDIRVLKMVHFGCEIFVAVGSPGMTGELLKTNVTPVSITTGRGCK